MLARWRAIFQSDRSGSCVRFLLEEILPEVSKRDKLADNPGCRAICNISSSGICPFTVAWQRLGTFRKVDSHAGSFLHARGCSRQRPSHSCFCCELSG